MSLIVVYRDFGHALMFPSIFFIVASLNIVGFMRPTLS